MATLCADCGVLMLGLPDRRSFYFARPLCEACYRAEICRPTPDAEVFVLEQLFRKSAA